MLDKMTNFEFRLHLQLQNKALELCLCCITNPLCCYFNVMTLLANTDSQTQPAVVRQDKIISQQVCFSVVCGTLPGVLYFSVTYYNLQVLQPFKESDQCLHAFYWLMDDTHTVALV